jgi:methionyl-tRNA formyltransferase
MLITIITDNPSSWFVEYGEILSKRLSAKGHNVTYVFDKQEIKEGDICFILSCSKIIQKEFLIRNKHNIVIHASDLPAGKGFSPLQWQILEGKNNITLTLIEAVEGVDAGPYYFKDEITYKGTELHDELREILANKIIEMCFRFIYDFKIMQSIPQEGKETFYPKRTRKDDEVDPNKTIKELFNQFRIANNNQFPLFFEIDKQLYTIKVEKL